MKMYTYQHLHFIIKSMMICVLFIMISVNTFGLGFTVDGLFYEITSEENLTVKFNSPDYHGNYQGDIVIPESVYYKNKRYSVTSIGGKAFYGCPFLYSVTIPKTITSIEPHAFFDCVRLTTITFYTKRVEAWFACNSHVKNIILGEGVESVADKAFYNCQHVASLTISSTVREIGNYAFYGCWGITELLIPGNVKHIGEGAFHNCVNLCKLVISNGVRTIGDDAFNNCRPLHQVKFPQSVTSIGFKAFHLTNVNYVELPASLPKEKYGSAFRSGITIKKYTETTSDSFNPISDSKNVEQLKKNVATIDSHKQEVKTNDDMSSCWFVYGKKRELESENVIANDKIADNFNKEYFSEIKKDKKEVFNLYSTAAKVLSNHPSDSYELSKNDKGYYYLRIIDPSSFWTYTNYLVIVVE